MNYEVNPFQDYESITVDELKDQANSLLNLVTEERRPLRVFMNNGKEFLLFPQDLLALICDSDFRLILLSAMRYAMGRNTCMPMVVADYIKRHIQLLDDKFLVLAADDIRRHLEDYAEHELNPNLWQGLLDALETEQRERATRKARKIRPCPACGKPLEIMSIADNQHSPGGFDVGKDGIHHDEQHGDDLLYDVGLFYGGGDQKKPLHAGGRADRNHCGNRRKHYSGGIYVSSRRLWLRPGRIFSAKMSVKTEK